MGSYGMKGEEERGGVQEEKIAKRSVSCSKGIGRWSLTKRQGKGHHHIAAWKNEGDSHAQKGYVGGKQTQRPPKTGPEANWRPADEEAKGERGGLSRKPSIDSS